MEIFVVSEVLADQLGADHLAVLLDQAAIGLMREESCAMPGHAERINETGNDRHNDDHHDRGTDLSQHGTRSSGKADSGDGEIDQLDADERHDDPANAIDQQVPAQDAAAPGRR